MTSVLKKMLGHYNLIAKIDEQMQIAINKDYTPMQCKWVTDEQGKQTKVEWALIVNILLKINKTCIKLTLLKIAAVSIIIQDFYKVALLSGNKK